MNCPFCGSSQIMVTNSRPTKGSSQIWRRRKCLNCDGVFTTYERMDLSHLTVIKRSGKRQRYSRAKLYSGIYHSLIDKKGVDRGEASALSEEITSKIEQQIIKSKSKKIRSNQILDMVLGRLQKTAPDAFLRFLAYKKGESRRKMKKLLRSFLK